MAGIRGRRSVFVAAGVGAVGLAVVAALWLATPSGGTGLYERLGHELGCQCGTCPKRPIATCGCGFADRMLDELRTAADSGLDEGEIRAEFIARYGPTVEIAPSASGLDLTAWLAPMLALMVGGVVVAWLVSTWSRGAAVPAPDVDPSRQASDGEGPTDIEASRARNVGDREVDELLEG